jgi:23S rRNA (adenine2503-C2)-methyltransferase
VCVVARANHPLHLVRPETAGLAPDRPGHHPGMDRRPAELREQEVSILLGDQLVTGLGQGPQSDLVRHRRSRHVDGLFLAEQRGHAPFEVDDGGVLAALFVADLGSRHRLAHAAARLGFRVGTEVDHARILQSVDITALQETLERQGEPGFRARQVWSWAARGASGYSEMTDVPAVLRSRLAERIPFSTLDVEHEARSRDGTVKTLFRTGDRLPVEAVLMRFRDGRRSVCLSSQSGCPLTCTFCATGQMKFRRNLTASEMLDQALHFRRLEAIDHVVFMGMGEPMLNVDEVIAAAQRLPDLGVTHRRTTVSTIGWLPGLRKFVDEVAEPVRLALSLHAAEPALRSQLMPVNDRYPLADVLAECRRYFELRRRKVFVEYVMLAGVNDRVEQARSLAELLDPRMFKVNLIPYNPTGSFTGSSPKAIAAFESELRRSGIPTTVRLTRGRDIAAACGQLAASA